MSEKKQQAGMKALANVKFTLHVHLDDGTTKDIECVGVVQADPKQDHGEIENGNHGT